MSRAKNKQLFSNVIRAADPTFGNCSSSATLSQEKTPPSFFFISNYMYGGCLTFTAHLLHTLNRKKVFRIAKKIEKRKKNFGYGIRYQNVPLEYLDSVDNIFITDMFQHFECLEKIRRIKEEKGKEVTIVVHDPGEIFRFNEPYLKYWNIITIRKSMQQYLRDKYGIESKFIYHPFYPYPIQQEGDIDDDVQGENKKMQAVSISRIDFNKNIEIILDANKRARKNLVKIYGWANKEYVSEQLDTVAFNQYYQGKYAKSFDATSTILKKAKFMIDLSSLPNDGGGTQYTFLDAVYHDCAIILNRQWIENVDREYRDFKEGENCYAVSNSEELRELLDGEENIDTTKIVQNARKLLVRHIVKAEEWNEVTMSLQN
jgi:glycosyltransferase involved in cell wall biosynthesis